MAVFVLDRRKRSLMPCSEKRARLLLQRGRARVHRLVPFTIRLVDRRVEDSALQSLRVKLDPGSKITGLALVRGGEEIDAATGEIRKAAHVLLLIEITHRGQAIRDALTARRAFRRRRQQHQLGAVPGPQSDWPAGGNRHGRQDEVQSHATGHSQGACARCGVRGRGGCRSRLARADAAGQGRRARVVSAHATGSLRLPAWSPHPAETPLRVSNRRPGEGCRAVGQESRNPRRAGGRASQREFQHPDATRRRSRHSSPALRRSAAR